MSPTTRFMPQHRTQAQLYSRFYGVELDMDGALFAVMERNDGKAEAVPAPTFNLITRYFLESGQDPHHSPEHRAALAQENALIDNVLGVMNDTRTAMYPASRNQKPVTFVVASPAFPPVIAHQAAEIWQRFSGMPLARVLKKGPTRT